MFGEAIQIEAVVPVRSPYQRKAVRAEMRCSKGKTAAQVLKQRLCERRVVVKIDGFAENAPVTGLAEIRVCPCYEPQRIIIEAAPHTQISFLGERLVLMVGTPVRKLGGCYIQYTLSGALRYHMNKTEKILAGVAESHSAPHTALKITGGPAHIESYHTLVLIPYVYHTVQLLNRRRDTVIRKQLFPIIAKIIEGTAESFI